MELSSHPPILIEDSSLRDWKVIGSGGFGQVFRARHHQWGCDVAVKLLHYDDGSSRTLLREIEMMRRGSSPYVIQVLGVFQGRLPSSGPAHLGLVMEVMERGSLASLQEALAGALPWSLVFRLAHQVALGINFLHSLSPAVLHLDLKPSNVLLDSHLNAKLTDFGLARIHHSVTRVSKKDSSKEGGTYSYMPPEAFDLSYNPTRASDIYSYGILLWSIVTGKEPYANVISSLVPLRIPEGDRPSLDEVRNRAAERQGLTELMSLMERCWDAKPRQRPSAHDCVIETEQQYKMHKHAILDAVHQVLKKLDEKEAANLTEQIERVHISDTPDSNRARAVNYDVPTGPRPVQEMAGAGPPHQRSTTRHKALSSPRPASFCDVPLGRSPSPDHVVKASSVQPISSPPSSPRTRRLLPSRPPKNMQPTLRQTMFPSQYHRQFSSPDTFSTSHPAIVRIHLSEVTGFQYGSNNNMHIYIPDNTERRRHPTAPSRVNSPMP